MSGGSGSVSRERFRELYEANLDFAWRSLVRLGVRHADLEDATQEVFLIVFRQVESFEGRAKFTTWLFRICYHVAQDRRRRASHRYEVLGEGDFENRVDTRSSAEALVQQREDVALFERALSSMSLEQRAVFVMFELEEITCEQIATTLELPLGTVYSRLRRARQLFDRSLRAARAADERLWWREGA